jgi:hypothetical protein
MRGTGVSFLGNVLLRERAPDWGKFGAVSLRVYAVLLNFTGSSSDFLSEPGIAGLLCCKFCSRRAPRFGREKFSVVVGSDWTLVRGKPIRPSIGEDIGDSSPSVSPRIDPALFENGTLSPFLKLPLL